MLNESLFSVFLFLESWTSSLRSIHSNRYDFPAKAHCLCRWYGLTDFVVVSPKSFSLTSQDKINSIQSAMRVAALNSGWYVFKSSQDSPSHTVRFHLSSSISSAVPLFLQALDDWRKFYLGCSLSPSIETTFEMVHLYHIPEKFRHLTGLLDVFKGKLVRVKRTFKVVLSVCLGSWKCS